jgi:cell division septation protein DedD
VNDSSEATHYQIELTSRQVLGGLVVLLVCLFASFFAGVWIGRNAEADSAANELARVDEVARGGERFDFFSQTGAPQGGAAGSAGDEAAPEAGDFPAAGAEASLDQGDFGPDPDDAELGAGEGDHTAMAATDPEDLFAGDEAEPTGDELAPPEEMGRGGPPTATGDGPGRRRRAAARAAEEETAAASEERPPPPGLSAPRGEPATGTDAAAGTGSTTAAAAPASKPAAAAESGFHIQVLATSDRAKAEALVSRLVGADFEAFIVPSNEGGRTMYRVRVGPFSDRTIAAGKAQELESRWGLDSWISPGTP